MALECLGLVLEAAKVARGEQSPGEGGGGAREPPLRPSQRDGGAPGPEMLGACLAQPAERAATELAAPREKRVGEGPERLPDERGPGDEDRVEAVVGQSSPALG